MIKFFIGGAPPRPRKIKYISFQRANMLFTWSIWETPSPTSKGSKQRSSGVAMAQAIAPAPSLGAGRRHPAQPALEVRGGAILRPRSGRKIDPRKRGLLFMFRAFFASLFDPDYGMNDGQIHSIAGTGRTAEDAAKAPTKLQSYHQASLDTMSAAMESAGCASGG